MIAALITAALLLAFIPQESGIVRDRVDLLEVNRFHNDEAQPVFVQLIAWEWHDRDGCFHVVDWKLLKANMALPQFDYTRRIYVARWLDGETSREVSAPQYRETWTQVDVELEDRKAFHESRRRRLGRRP
jgi:hypothetical protein